MIAAGLVVVVALTTASAEPSGAHADGPKVDEAAREPKVANVANVANVAVASSSERATGSRALSLDEAVRIALSTDPSLAKARIGTDRAKLAVLVANLERVHASVDASVQGAYVGASAPFVPPFDPKAPAFASGIIAPSNLQASVDAPLFSGFRVESDIARAEDLEKAATFDLASAQRSVALAVADAYFSVRRLAILERAQAESEARLDESERVVTARVNAGLAAGLDKNRAASRRAQLDADRATLEAQDREGRAKLATVLGIDEAVELTTDPPGANNDGGASVVSVDALIQRALDARPELKAAQWRAASVDEEKRAAESAMWPQLDAGALAQIGNNPLIAGVGSHEVAPSPIPFAGSNAVLQGGVTLSINLFDTWTTTHNIEDAAHRRRLADEDLRAARRQVENDVRIAQAHVVSLRAQHAALVKAKTIEADDVDILQHAYERGEVLLTELLDEQLRLADVTRQIIDVDAQAAVAQIELDSAVGTDSFGVSP